MRLGVLDVGSNTVHLLVVDAHTWSHPMPMHDDKVYLRLAECINKSGALTKSGEQSLIKFVAHAAEVADQQGCEEMIAFATSAVRDASNSKEVLDRVHAKTGVRLSVLSGADEARLTFLAVRRWFGWSAGQLLCLDIGGGSLELGTGMDEMPDIASSMPLGAGRLTREWLAGDPATKSELAKLREYVDDTIASQVKPFLKAPRPDRAVATSKTFRSLARLTGAAPSSEGLRVPRELTLPGLRQIIGFISHMSSKDLSDLEGVSSQRAHQLLAGAVVAESAMRHLKLSRLEICPWALREGVILRRLDMMDEDE
ncbi:Ppx/GppA phosphatase family protein [Blastococcus sp. Marseille-P5729]|uniref:Ppx/GppA phosphatase family protein n=1 Tax=Blastococcus sp. Marseille-P5729 TaxID=2086582 RepID=UPI000D0E61F4|nr:Ppx/GppA phosphatase family protein [Blastococcus sp. Marseille-P5729]